jgi:hypothetical protein
MQTFLLEAAVAIGLIVEAVILSLIKVPKAGIAGVLLVTILALVFLHLVLMGLDLSSGEFLGFR